MAIRNATIALDFDGTVVTHEYPHIGEDAGAVPVLKELVANGYRLILHTMRHGALLEQAVDWFRSLGIPLRFVDGCSRPVVDWPRVREMLVDQGFLD